MVRNQRGPNVLLIVIVSLAIGCESSDQRLAEFAERSTAQQARQNEALARQSEQTARQSGELAQASHDLVEQDAIARRELIQAHDRSQQQLTEQRAVLDQQREQLHVERQALSQAAIRDPVIAQALIAIGLILATLLPLVLTAYALKRLPDANASEELLTSALVDELAPFADRMPSPLEADVGLPDGREPRLFGPEAASGPSDTAGENSGS